jgi:hypothetical protein
LALLPSVTSIIGILDKPQLTRWKMREVAKAAIAIPGPQGDEPVERFADRAIEAAMSQVGEAADLGSRIHAAIENLMRGGAEEPSEELRPYVKPVLDWMRQVGVKVTHSEIVLVNAVHGFAGRVDALFTWGDAFGKMGILDFKTKKTKEGEKVEAYDEHTLQLRPTRPRTTARAFAARCRGQLVHLVHRAGPPRGGQARQGQAGRGLRSLHADVCGVALSQGV